MVERDYEYDIALSFAREDRPYGIDVAGQLITWGVSLFYDEYKKVDLWGKDLYAYLMDVYRNKAKYTLMFISKH